ncbi:MAG TPA: site-specific tyrosine recombinase XerD [Actinomycetota bacterium]|nr:site-specific tyrosine recombinase XerD [Actinomycetota bacterium]
MSALPDGLRRALDSFVDYLRVERGASPRTVEAYRREVLRYLRHLAGEGVRTPSQARPADVAAVLQARADAGAAASTIHRALAAVRHFHRFCIRDGLADSDPAALVDGPKRGLSLPKALATADIVAIIEAANGSRPADLRDRAMLELLYAAGLRVSELVGLDVDDVDLDSRSLRALGKGEKERVVPIGGPAADAVGRYLVQGRPSLLARSRGTAALFVSARGSRLSRQSAWKVVKRYAGRALPDRRVHPHVLRHSFATHLLQGGADVRVVQEALGHARLSTTQVYTLVSRDTLKDVIESAHPRGRTRRRPAAGS